LMHLFAGSPINACRYDKKNEVPTRGKPKENIT